MNRLQAPRGGAHRTESKDVQNRTCLTPRSGLVAALLLVAAAPVPAQQVRVRAVAPVGALAQPTGQDDAGTPVEMFENPNLDRYLRRAQAFLDREDFPAAIQVLQDVVEGRTIEVVGPPAEDGQAGGEPVDEDKDGAAEETKETQRAATLLDARQSVFSLDGRLYRPVRRLCHELLSRLPPIGLELYRASYEVAANEMLERALADGSLTALEEVANRYFITIPAGRAMMLLADRLMHEGRYRAAVQVLRDLIEVYPAEERKVLGVSDVWGRFKIALCLRMAGEVGVAHEQAVEMARQHPGETLRILGELQAVADLPDSELFAGELVAPAAHTADRGPGWLTQSTEELVPMWQFRFSDPQPYRDPGSSTNERNVVFFEEGYQATTMPHAGRYGAATWVAFGSPSPDDPAAMRASFLEHFRLRVADAASGVQLAASGAPDLPPPPRENHPRVRIAACDFALLRPVEDGERRYVIVGYEKDTKAQAKVLRTSKLVAYGRDTMEQLWTSDQWTDGEAGLEDVTFLAAPTVFGERLLLPALRRSAYSLECLDRRTGRPLWHTPLHSGGSAFFKAPGTPVAVQGGVAFVVTNAGCLAAVDAFAGDLRWIRRYERTDPRREARKKKQSRSPSGMRWGSFFVDSEMPSFLPNDLIVDGGLVITAPCDSDVMLCLDGASGEPVWMLDAALPTSYAPYGQLRTIVGATDEDLFALSDGYLVCIGLRGGLVKWASDLPSSMPRFSERGRGTVVGDHVLLPGDRELLVYDAAGRQPLRRIALPSFDPSRDPVSGSFHVVSHGPWLAAGYAGAIEVFSSREALRGLAASTSDVLRRATLLVEAGDRAAAEAVLTERLRHRDLPAPRRASLSEVLLSLVRQRANERAATEGVAAGLAVLDEVAALFDERDLRLDWYLARLELCKDVGDLHAHEREQRRLYEVMEGRL
jgi:outer membrane protein assembly factor BamB